MYYYDTSSSTTITTNNNNNKKGNANMYLYFEIQCHLCILSLLLENWSFCNIYSFNSKHIEIHVLFERCRLEMSNMIA